MNDDLTVEELMRERHRLLQLQRIGEIHRAYLQSERSLTGEDAEFLYEQLETLAGFFGALESQSETPIKRTRDLLKYLGFLE